MGGGSLKASKMTKIQNCKVRIDKKMERMIKIRGPKKIAFPESHPMYVHSRKSEPLIVKSQSNHGRSIFQSEELVLTHQLRFGAITGREVSEGTEQVLQKRRNIDLETLYNKQIQFQIELLNKFAVLQDLEDTSLDQFYKGITDTVKDEIRSLYEKRKKLKPFRQLYPFRTR